jgi:hypothetical protein
MPFFCPTKVRPAGKEIVYVCILVNTTEQWTGLTYSRGFHFCCLGLFRCFGCCGIGGSGLQGKKNQFCGGRWLKRNSDKAKSCLKCPSCTTGGLLRRTYGCYSGAFCFSSFGSLRLLAYCSSSSRLRVRSATISH